ncbi:MAG: hypothetical protein AAF686_01620 [Pseudomonadota bacterium]
MSDNTPSSDTALGLYAVPRRDGVSSIEILAGIVSLGWLLVTGAFFLFFAEPTEAQTSAYEVAVVLLAVFLPAVLIWVAAVSARSGQIIREESLNLRDAAAVIRQAAVAQAQPKMIDKSGMPDAQFASSASPETSESAPAPKMQPDPSIVPFSSMRVSDTGLSTGQGHPASAPTETEQPSLPLDREADETQPPLGRADFILALNFPRTAEDKAGFDALRRALRHREAAQIIQASQDVLTLLSQDGIYMDDLIPDRAHPDLWRRFAAGERGRQIAALGGIRDRSSLALSAARMKQDTIFRDAAHHFLRLFDRMMARFCEFSDDADISALADTRTARAFMLLGRVAGTFD